MRRRATDASDESRFHTPALSEFFGVGKKKNRRKKGPFFDRRNEPAACNRDIGISGSVTRKCSVERAMRGISNLRARKQRVRLWGAAW